MRQKELKAKITIRANEYVIEEIIDLIKCHYRSCDISYVIERDLTDREVEILRQVVDGRNNREISEKLNVSVDTIKLHVSNIYTKLSVKDRVQAAVKAIREGLV